MDVGGHFTASRCEKWIFKGGTCLKKAYFETYRFSEDLDFTIPKEEPFDDQMVTGALNDIADWVDQQSGVAIPKERTKTEKYKNPRGSDSIESSVYYAGPLATKASLPRIKFDLAQDEIVVDKPILRSVFHNYQDQTSEGFRVLCYSLEELFAEKIRAFTDRLLPRDLYDIVNIYRHVVTAFDSAKVRLFLEKKCQFKNIPYPTMSLFSAHARHGELPKRWEEMLGHQLPQLPPLADFLKVLPEILGWLGGVQKPSVLRKIEVRESGVAIDDTWHPSSSMSRWNQPVPVEIIRFAGANHLCIEMTYWRKQDNSVRSYILEPYSLRRSKRGEILLYGRKVPSGEDRCFHINRILEIKPTDRTFVPAYQVEFTMMEPAFARSLALRPQLGYGRRKRRF